MKYVCINLSSAFHSVFIVPGGRGSLETKANKKNGKKTKSTDTIDINFLQLAEQGAVVESPIKLILV